MCKLVLQPIAEIHAAGWAHVDLKPDNICFETGPGGIIIPYVIDFGSAVEATGKQTALCDFGVSAALTKRFVIFARNTFWSQHTIIETLQSQTVGKCGVVVASMYKACDYNTVQALSIQTHLPST